MSSVQITITRKSAANPWYQLGDDDQIFGGMRGCAIDGCPAVVVLNDAPDTFFDLHWQMYLVAINWGMNLAAISAMIGSGKAFLNQQGVGDPNNPRANYIFQSHLSDPDPRLDKLRSCDLNTHAGEETYSLTIALAAIMTAVRGVIRRRNSLLRVRESMAAIGTINGLVVKTMNGNQPPPMKPGTRRPRRVEEIVPSDYVMLPSDPEYRPLFVDANNIKSRSGGRYSIGPFAHGLVRPWLDEDMHSFLPLVSTKSRVVTPLRFWRKVAPGESFPSAFRRL